MSAPRFDFEELFDEDYLYFYAESLTLERTEQQVKLIWGLLGLEAGMSVLDLACGHGRIANRLAERGCQVTGIDKTAIFLNLARQDAAERKVDVEYIEGDMRSLPGNEHFDCIINWFTAYGYFEDDDNRKVLGEAYRTLKQGGKLLIEHQNRDAVLKNFHPAFVVERDGNYMIDQNRYDIFTGRSYTERIIIRDGQIRKLNLFIRFFTYTEIRDLLLQAGFKQVDGYGETGNLLQLDSRRMIVVAQK